jgi:hypothetical protein
MKMLLLTATLFAGISVFAQKHVGGEIALGARFGGSSGIDLKLYNGYNTSAFEFMGTWNFDEDIDGFTVTGLWEKLAPLTGSKQVSAFLGIGPTMAFGDKFKMGGSGILGIDWRFKMLPINLQFDWMPTYFFINDNHFSAVNGAVSVRYIFNHHKPK